MVRRRGLRTATVLIGCFAAVGFVFVSLRFEWLDRYPLLVALYCIGSAAMLINALSVLVELPIRPELHPATAVIVTILIAFVWFIYLVVAFISIIGEWLFIARSE